MNLATTGDTSQAHSATRQRAFVARAQTEAAREVVKQE